jgi:hypothetical protein
MLIGEPPKLFRVSKSVPDVRWAATAGKGGVDPDLEQGGNINVVMRRDLPPQL